MELLGIDIGASNLKAGRVLNGCIEAKSYKRVDREATSNKTLQDLFSCIDQVINKNIRRIGVGVPAVVDPDTGVVYDVQNIPAWKEIPLKDLIEDRYGLPVFINNDANCFAIGEKIFGKGKNLKNFIGLSLGTGIGMGVIINNKLYNGVLCGAGEIGMITYKDSIIEKYAGSFFFTENYDLTAEKMSTLAEQGNESALNAFKEYGNHLGEAIKNILYLYSPETIILGGSISLAYLFYERSIKSSLKSFAYQRQIENFKIEVSNLEGSAILGAAALCIENEISKS
jgi:glucokinase